MTLPTDPKARKAAPIYSGFLKYFPDAVAAVAMLSHDANEQHNPGEPVHWAKEKSTDELDALCRHLVDPLTAGGEPYDTDGHLHATKQAWRAMANLQRILDSGMSVKFPEPVMAEFPWKTDAKPLAFAVDSVPRQARSKCHVTCGSRKCEREGCSGENHPKYSPPPRICRDCGVDLDSNVRHAATCLAGC